MWRPKTPKAHGEQVPRLYKEAARILKRVQDGEGLHDLVFNCGHRNVKGIYALVCNALKNESLLNYVLDCSGILNNRLNPFMTRILVTELLWGKKCLPGNSVPVQITRDLESQLKEAVDISGIAVDLEVAEKPRYVRINTLLTTIQATIKRFKDDEWILLDTPDTYEEFLKIVSNLDLNEFMQDYHFPDVLVFSSKTNLYEHDLILNGFVIRQDKASCLPTVLLNPPPGSVVLDMCAAPGIKTAHLVNLMKNKGIVHAVDSSQKRYDTMLEQLKLYCGEGNTCIKTHVKDSTLITTEHCDGVQYILVDPSCSGSGMTKRPEDKRSNSADCHRIRKLAGFQVRLLVQALTAFPDVERVVYCTCSELVEENEMVVQSALAKVEGFQVVAPKLQKPWGHRGNPDYNFGENCIVSDLQNDLTNGFFVAVLERIDNQRSSKGESSVTNSNESAENEWQVPKKKHTVKRKINRVTTALEVSDKVMCIDDGNKDDDNGVNDEHLDNSSDSD